MKIIFTNKVYLPHMGGVEIYIHNIAQELLKNGHEVTVITADENIRNIEKEVIDNENVIRIPAKRIGGLYVLKNWKDYEIIEKEISDSDIVHCNDCKFLYLYLAKKKKKYKYRLIISSHGWMFHTSNHYKFKQWYFKNAIARHSFEYDEVICVSYQDKRIAEKYGILDCELIQNGVDYKKFGDIQPKEVYGNNLIYWGRISPNKGVLECLKKLAPLKNYHFKLIGACEDIEYKKLLVNYINENNMKNKVEMLGKLPDEEIHKLIEEADYIIMPSLHEGFGIALVEGLLSNRPIIANKIESFETILKEVRKEEYLFDFSSKESDIEIKMNELRHEPSPPYNIEQFSMENMFEKTFNCYFPKNH